MFPEPSYKWQVSKFIQNDHVHAHQAHGYAPRISLGLLLPQRIDQIHRRVVPHTLYIVRQAGDCCAIHPCLEIDLEQK
ncbi:hypothetical protein D3C71_1005430 [compost metagenome]